MASDLIDAVIGAIEAETAITEPFGDTWDQATQTGVAKFFADFAPSVDLPYCVIGELGETYDYMTRSAGGAVVNYTAPGQMMFSIFAAERLQARQLGFTIAKVLNDATLLLDSGEQVMEFRMIRSQFNPIPQVGPGSPAVFNRVFIFEYMFQGAL